MYSVISTQIEPRGSHFLNLCGVCFVAFGVFERGHLLSVPFGEEIVSLNCYFIRATRVDGIRTSLIGDDRSLRGRVTGQNYAARNVSLRVPVLLCAQ
jgi:hypothetical protein